MSKQIKFEIALVSDAEVSSGLGSNLVDSLVARDTNGNPVIPASHIKGLMLQNIKDIPECILDGEKRSALLGSFGKPGEAFENSSKFSVTNANLVSKNANATRYVSRTALNEFGTAKEGSLRTCEAICAGTKFSGSVYVQQESALLESVVCYALLSIFELGGSRNRGAGACTVSIDGCKTPGALLKDIECLNPAVESKTEIVTVGDPNKIVVARVSFETTNPICIPETPIVGNNTIVSGFTIPASAVQGCILTRVNELNSSVATACFESEGFRTWPLEPLPTGAEYKGAFAVRASASHKISKLANDDKSFNFCDEKIEDYPWDEKKNNLPIKSADGVMIRKKDGSTVLWRSGDMARHLTAHGVINGGESGNERNFFTVQSLAEHFFVGFVTMPEDAFLLLQKSLEKNPMVSVGKSRSVRGQGKLVVEQVESLPMELPKNRYGKEVPAFIVQSPLLIDEDLQEDSADAILKALVERYWTGCKVVNQSAGVQILFGWNRHKNGLQEAKKVIAPGSVFCLESCTCNVQELLMKGVGLGKERGFGSVLLHPNIASVKFSESAEIRSVKDTDDAAKHGLELWKKNKEKNKNLLSPSQISTLMTLVEHDQRSALAHLEKQIKNRPDNIWSRWEGVFSDVKNMIETREQAYSRKAIKVWYDLAVATERGK